LEGKERIRLKRMSGKRVSSCGGIVNYTTLQQRLLLVIDRLAKSTVVRRKRRKLDLLLLRKFVMTECCQTAMYSAWMQPEAGRLCGRGGTVRVPAAIRPVNVSMTNAGVAAVNSYDHGRPQAWARRGICPPSENVQG